MGVHTRLHTLTAFCVVDTYMNEKIQVRFKFH